MSRSRFPLLAAVAQGNGSDRERSAALLAIGELGEHSGVSILSNVFSRAQTPQITDAAAQALLLAGDEKGLRTLLVVWQRRTR